MEENKFKQWLENEVGLKARSSRDVISRLKRANRFINVSLFLTSDHAIAELSHQPNFQELSYHTKSQLRRSIKFFFKFRDYNSIVNRISEKN